MVGVVSMDGKAQKVWLRSVRNAFVLFVILLIVFTAANTVTNMIPRDLLEEHAEQSDSSGLVTNIYEYKHRVFCGRVSYDNNRYILEIARQKDMGDPFSTMVVADIVDLQKDAPAEWCQYFRYWHGWQLLTNVCLAFGTIDLVKVPAFVLTVAGTVAFILALKVRLGIRAAAVFVGVLVLSTHLAFNFMGDLLLSISFFSFLLALSGGLLLYERGRLSWPDLLVWIFGTGCLYAYLDFLTIPAVAAGLVMFCTSLFQSGGFKRRLLCGIAALVVFGFGYGAMWAAKWVLAAIVLSPDYVMENVFGEMGIWSTASDELPRPHWPQFVQSFYLASPKLAAICVTCGYSFVASPVSLVVAAAIVVGGVRAGMHSRKKPGDGRREVLREALLALAPILVVLAYFIGMTTHALVHIPVFGYKNWCLVYALVLLAVMRAAGRSGWSEVSASA